MRTQSPGLHDWLWQRISAIIVTSYIVFLAIYIALHHPLQYWDWKALFNHQFMRIASILVFGCVAYHSWLGIKRVLGDYITNGVLRTCLRAAVILSLFSFFIWGVEILWGISS